MTQEEINRTHLQKMKLARFLWLSLAEAMNHCSESRLTTVLQGGDSQNLRAACRGAKSSRVAAFESHRFEWGRLYSNAAAFESTLPHQ